MTKESDTEENLSPLAMVLLELLGRAVIPRNVLFFSSRKILYLALQVKIYITTGGGVVVKGEKR